jgi:hypothetical protein
VFGGVDARRAVMGGRATADGGGGGGGGGVGVVGLRQE